MRISNSAPTKLARLVKDPTHADDVGSFHFNPMLKEKQKIEIVDKAYLAAIQDNKYSRKQLIEFKGLLMLALDQIDKTSIEITKEHLIELLVMILGMFMSLRVMQIKADKPLTSTKFLKQLIERIPQMKRINLIITRPYKNE